eukprot:TRINITY_DN10241_c0_g1_i1.p1 TRINITY_DN10241_c0_g1~~TRINITY_DN10241_c0_g1_i1.p1  ORF type:complete len:280 (-),score=37.39 TRINITY_DN10241_c0_g1_i1:393-1232(-)
MVMVFSTLNLFFVLLLIYAHANQNEVDKIRLKLGIPNRTQGVLIFGQTAHLDWDWLNFFTTNVNNTPPDVANFWNEYVQPTDSIFLGASKLLETHPNFGYAIAEVSFLREFSLHHPAQFKTMVAHSDRFRMVGGGLTTPDNMLVHGEAFIRNYLIGLSWQKEVGLSWTRKIWLPDNFGHDSQLPVVLEAMGVEGVGFARVPGSCLQRQNPVRSSPHYTHNGAHEILLDKSTGGLEFMWTSSDGSSVFSYYMPTHYCPGSDLRAPEGMGYSSWEYHQIGK